MCSVHNRLYGSLPMLGHGVSVVLSHLQRWEAKGCRIVALHTLLLFSGTCGSDLVKMASDNSEYGCSLL